MARACLNGTLRGFAHLVFWTVNFGYREVCTER